MPVIYHITTQAEWNTAKEKGFYESVSLKEEGFIHCANREQVPGVLERYFKGKENLVQLSIDTDRLTSQLIYEWSPSIADTFPHIYGPVNLEAITETQNVERGMLNA